jgi:hypothetical protein
VIAAIGNAAFDNEWGADDLLEFTNPEIYRIHRRAMYHHIRPPRLTHRIRELTDFLKSQIYGFIRDFEIDLLIVENALTIPLNLPLGMALTEFIAETGFPTIGHHHDFYWERMRFMVNCVADYLSMAFPPSLPSIRHVVINSMAAFNISMRNGVSTVIIPRNTTVPTSNSRIFSTTEDDQTVVRIHVVQGERELARDNRTLGRFELVGLLPAPRGVPQIEVSFDIDADGVVNVSAKDLGTGKSQAIRVAAATGLSEEEIGKLVREAEQNAAADRQRREWIDLRNQADGLIYSTERTLEEFQENVKQEDSNALRDAIQRAREAMAGDDAARLRQAVGELSSLTYKMTETLYAELGGKGQ